jgi:hypothetical protein
VKVTERMVIGVATALVVIVALVVALVDGRLAGFQYPGSEVVFALAFALCGAVILGAHPGHTVGRLLMWAGLIGAIAQLLGQLDSGSSLALLSSWGLMLIAIARFPDGDWVSRWAKWFTWGMLGAFAMQAVIWVALPWIAEVLYSGGPALPWLVRAGESNRLFTAGIAAASVLGLGFTVATVVGMWRLVRGDPVRSRQVGVVILGAIVSFVVGLPARRLEELGSPLAGVLNAMGGLIFPISVMIAILRLRLYEIDRVISRTITYAVVLGVMGGVYVAVFAGLGLLLSAEGDLAVAVATLAAVAVSVPLVRRVRRWVDHRFFRNRYDAAAVVARVADDLRTTVDMAEVESRAESVISEVFAPESVGVWVAE